MHTEDLGTGSIDLAHRYGHLLYSQTRVNTVSIFSTLATSHCPLSSVAAPFPSGITVLAGKKELTYVSASLFCKSISYPTTQEEVRVLGARPAIRNLR